MRTEYSQTLTRAESNDLLTTGEAAHVLGMSRQHVVNLCNAGDLPFVSAGKHRRVARRDIEAINAGTRRLTRDQLRSLWLGHQVAAKLVEDPERVLSIASENLERMRTSSVRGSAREWLAQWQRLLAGPLEDILEALTSRSPLSRELRQNTPFAGVLSEEQRQRVLDAFSRAHRREAIR